MDPRLLPLPPWTANAPALPRSEAPSPHGRHMSATAIASPPKTLATSQLNMRSGRSGPESHAQCEMPVDDCPPPPNEASAGGLNTTEPRVDPMATAPEADGRWAPRRRWAAASAKERHRGVCTQTSSVQRARARCLASLLPPDPPLQPSWLLRQPELLRHPSPRAQAPRLGSKAPAALPHHLLPDTCARAFIDAQKDETNVA